MDDPQDNLPGGSLPYGNQIYKDTDTDLWVGSKASKFRGIAKQSDLDYVTSNPYDTRGTLFRFYKKLLNGSSFNSGVLQREAVKLRLGSLFDSVATYCFVPIANKFTNMFGANGGIIPFTSLTGGGYYHLDTSDTAYWFNGSWHGINGAGSLRFLIGGGLTPANQIKVYYITEPGAGSFKVQVSSTSTTTGYSDVGSVVNCDAPLSAGIFTHDTTLASYATQIVQVSGNVKILFVTQTNTDPNIDGVSIYNMAVGGLNLDSVTTPSAILNPVFTDLGIDLMFWEAKENPTAMAAQGYAFFDSWRANSPLTDWILMGSSPQTEGSSNDNNLASNALLKQYAQAHRWLYYDGYTPLISIQEMRDIGWLGGGVDELHLSISTGVYRAAELWRIIGVEGVLNLGSQFGATITKEPVLQNGQGIHWTDSLGAFKGRVKPVGSDLSYDSARWHTFRLMRGTVLATLKQSVGWEMPTGASYRFADGNRLESTSGQMAMKQATGSVLVTLAIADGDSVTKAATVGQIPAIVQTGVEANVAISVVGIPYTKATINAAFPTAKKGFIVINNTTGYSYIKNDNSASGEWSTFPSVQLT
ncbi:MAG TPA: hypothetical protein VK541_14740 [Pedobacter sp.]|uniref:hypothetical protein n=1 Tax=Pedobacter sp. TaxID=1411316 RepID=UPI002C527B65|nr:hypothetical protein [Pedobacter sp.]HMI03738.1 hypothetical protein [Pedobacter sp.]